MLAYCITQLILPDKYAVDSHYACGCHGVCIQPVIAAVNKARHGSTMPALGKF